MKKFNDKLYVIEINNEDINKNVTNSYDESSACKIDYEINKATFSKLSNLLSIVNHDAKKIFNYDSKSDFSEEKEIAESIIRLSQEIIDQADNLLSEIKRVSLEIFTEKSATYKKNYDEIKINIDDIKNDISQYDTYKRKITEIKTKFQATSPVGMEATALIETRKSYEKKCDSFKVDAESKIENANRLIDINQELLKYIKKM